MTRAWLIVLLAMPAIVAAQTAPTPSAGQITFPTVVHSGTDGFINAAECVGGTIELSWAPEASTTVITGYQLYATNKTGTTGSCPKTNGDKGDTSLLAGPVGVIITNDLTNPMLDVEFATSLIATQALGSGACDNTSDVNIGLCIQATNGGADVATARGTLTLSRSAPNAPASASASAGENALRVSWPESQGNPAVEYYIAEALTGPSIDPTQTATVSGSSGPVGTNEARIGGLTNGVIYEVRVTAYSTADNASDPVFAGTASPAPVNDFWETYRAAGGREQGGCASGAGAAGALALLAIASLVALRRRR